VHGSEPQRTLRELGVRPSKGLGQHFLVDERVAERQIDHARIAPSDVVLEIGPGLGVLTRALASRAEHVVAIEADLRLADRLREVLPNVEVLHADALDIEWPRFDVFVSNLPYRISSPLTFKLLDRSFDRAVLMYQWEFAKRMVASPGTSDYSRLSVGVYRRAGCEILERVPRNAFHPQPRVDSALVRLVPRPPPFRLQAPELFDAIVAALFEHRRKTIENGLRLAWPQFASTLGPLEGILPSLPFRRRRIEELDPEEIASLVESMSRAKA